MSRQRNAHYHVPPVTVQLGTVLDVKYEYNGRRVTVTEWEGWQLLTDETAMDSERPRLWLLPGELEADDDRDAVGPAPATYERWHRRGFEFVSDLDVSDAPIGFRQGRVVCIGYRSDKWGRRGETHDYDHDFTEGRPPLLYTDRADIEDARAACIVGGDMRVTPRGID